MRYTELLDEYNKFMDNSGVRKFCQEKCVPHCCNHPVCTLNTCKKSLGCVSFICYILRDRIFSEKEAREWERMHNIACDKVHFVNGLYGITQMNIRLRAYSETMDALDFDSKDFEFLLRLNEKNFKIDDDLSPITYII